MIKAIANGFGADDAQMEAGVDAVIAAVPAEPVLAVAAFEAARDAAPNAGSPGVRPSLEGPGRAIRAAEEGETPDISALEAALRALHAAGADWVQIEEPILGSGIAKHEAAALREAYAALAACGPKIMLRGGAGDPGADLWTALSLPVAGLHLDLLHAPLLLRDALDSGVTLTLSLGLVDPAGASLAALDAAARWARVAARRHGAERIEIACAAPADGAAPQLTLCARRAAQHEPATIPAAEALAAIAFLASDLAAEAAAPRAAAQG